MTPGESPDEVVDGYSQYAAQYDDAKNLQSCWGRIGDAIAPRLQPRADHHVIVDVGCGTGHLLETLVRRYPDKRFVGVEPASGMRQHAEQRLETYPQVAIINGRFEDLPCGDHSVDFLYSVFAFHWASHLTNSVAELARVLAPAGEIDIYFTGRHTGREFTRLTNPIFVKYLGPVGLLQSAGRRLHLTVDQTVAAFTRQFPLEALTVEESFETHYDDLETHWGWWVPRVAGHFARILPESRRECDVQIREAISSLDESDRGIPYTVHLLRVHVKR